MTTELVEPPAGFRIGHWADEVGRTGCTVVLAPEGTRGGVDVRGGGPGTRETDVVGPFAATDRVNAVMLSGGSAFGLAASDGAMRWLEEHDIGFPTPAGKVPIVAGAVIFDLPAGDASARPTAESGYAACEAARDGVPERGKAGVGMGAGAGQILGRDAASESGFGYAAARGGLGETVAAVAVANPFGDIVDSDGSMLAGARSEGAPRAVDFVAALTPEELPPELDTRQHTTLVCVMTSASLDKGQCGRVARGASAGIARAINPVFTDVDGDTVFCLASGTGSPPSMFEVMQLQTLAASVTAAAIRDAVANAN